MAPRPKSRQRAVVCNSKTTRRKLLELDWNICYYLQKLRNYGVPKFIIDYLASFLTRRTANVYLDLVTLCGEMPQGLWLGPLIFLTLIDDPVWNTSLTADRTKPLEAVQR